MDISSSLKQYGLSDIEARVYVILLKLVEASAYQLAKEAKIPRTSVYSALERLKNKGLVLMFRKNNVLYYTPENPKKLSDILEHKLAIINDIMPQMRALIESPEIKPIVKLYEGKEGLKTVWEDILVTCEQQSIKQLYAISHPALYSLLPGYFPKWVERRVGLGVNIKLIMPDITQAHNMANQLLREIKFLPEGHQYQSTVDIYANKLAFFSLKENEVNSVILESPAITEMFREFFLSMWEIL